MEEQLNGLQETKTYNWQKRKTLRKQNIFHMYFHPKLENSIGPISLEKVIKMIIKDLSLNGTKIEKELRGELSRAMMIPRKQERHR